MGNCTGLCAGGNSDNKEAMKDFTNKKSMEMVQQEFEQLQMMKFGELNLEVQVEENVEGKDNSTNSNSSHEGEEQASEQTQHKEASELTGRKAQPPYQFENGAVYTGEWMNGLRDGMGIQEWQDGSKYIG